MRAKTILTALFVVSLVVAAIAFVHTMPKGNATAPKEQILATTMPLAAGTLLRAQDVTWQAVSETLPDQIVWPTAAALEAKPDLGDETRASVYGAVLRHPLAAGEPISRGAFVKPGERDFLQVVLTPGSRAIAIPVSTGGASTGLLSPGDRVDVVLTQNFTKAENQQNEELRHTPLTRRSVSETVVENLRVLAIDTLDPKTTGVNANPANGNFGRTVTLEVTPEQVEQINVAAELGKLSVALRSVTGPSTTLATDSPTGTGPTTLAAVSSTEKPEHIKPTWAGDVSPALMGAAEPKAVAVIPKPVQVFHGSKAESVKTDE
jgi:pilus assembly protein CpaB